MLQAHLSKDKAGSVADKIQNVKTYNKTLQRTSRQRGVPAFCLTNKIQI